MNLCRRGWLFNKKLRSKRGLKRPNFGQDFHLKWRLGCSQNLQLLQKSRTIAIASRKLPPNNRWLAKFGVNELPRKEGISAGFLPFLLNNLDIQHYKRWVLVRFRVRKGQKYPPFFDLRGIALRAILCLVNLRPAGLRARRPIVSLRGAVLGPNLRLVILRTMSFELRTSIVSLRGVGFQKKCLSQAYDSRLEISFFTKTDVDFWKYTIIYSVKSYEMGNEF